MLSANTGLSIPPESHFIPYLHHRYSSTSRWDDAATFGLARDITSDAHFLGWGLNVEEALCSVTARRPKSFQETVRAFYELYAGREQKTRWGDKTPHYVFFLDTLLELFPGLVVVEIIRDG